MKMKFSVVIGVAGLLVGSVASDLHARVLKPSRQKQFCYGAVGKQCSTQKGAVPKKATALSIIGCSSIKNGKANCYVSPGTIMHDVCCAYSPNGMNCGGRGKDGHPSGEKNHDGTCVQKWHWAYNDIKSKSTWTEVFDVKKAADVTLVPSKRLQKGLLESKSTLPLCAPEGAKLFATYSKGFCCSGKASKKGQFMICAQKKVAAKVKKTFAKEQQQMAKQQPPGKRPLKQTAKQQKRQQEPQAHQQMPMKGQQGPQPQAGPQAKNGQGPMWDEKIPSLQQPSKSAPMPPQLAELPSPQTPIPTQQQIAKKIQQQQQQKRELEQQQSLQRRQQNHQQQQEQVSRKQQPAYESYPQHEPRYEPQPQEQPQYETREEPQYEPSEEPRGEEPTVAREPEPQEEQRPACDRGTWSPTFGRCIEEEASEDAAPPDCGAGAHWSPTLRSCQPD